MRIDPKAVPLSPARRAGNLLFLSGQIAFDKSGQMVGEDISAQTRQVLSNIEAVLAANDASLGDVVNATIWLADAKDFAAFNAVYGQHFAAPPPARSTVVSGLLAGALVEIAVIAQLGE